MKTHHSCDHASKTDPAEITRKLLGSYASFYRKNACIIVLPSSTRHTQLARSMTVAVTHARVCCRILMPRSTGTSMQFVLF